MNKNVDYIFRRLRLRHLELLVVLSEAGTMRAAADRLSLSQPAISKMLNEIEDALDARLFERSRQGVQLTAAGAAAVHRSRIVLGELAHAYDEVKAINKGASAVLRIGTFSVTKVVPAAVVHLRRKMPRLAVHFHEGTVRQLIQLLLQGDIDCVLGALTNELMERDTLRLLQSEVLLDDKLCVLVSDNNPALKRRGLVWKDLQHVEWITNPKQTLVRQAFITAFLDEGADPPEPVIETMSPVTAGALMRMDKALYCATRHEHAREEVSRGGLRLLNVHPEIPLPPLRLFTRRHGIDTAPIVREFSKSIKQIASG